MEITVFTGESYDETWATVFEGHLTQEQIEHLIGRYQQQVGFKDHALEQTGGGYYAEFFDEPATRRSEEVDTPEDDWEDEFSGHRELSGWALILFQDTLAPPTITETPMEDLIRDINELR